MSRIRAGLGIGIAATPSLPLDRTYELYEMWCYVGLLAAVAERFPASRPKIAEILRACPTASGLGIVLAGGKTNEIPLSANVWLAYQRRFSLKPSPDGARTLLLEVIPDLTISRVASDGPCVGLVVLDPKYRAHQSLLDGLRDMHVYRDAIIDSDGVRLVKAAAALAPRPAGLPDATAGLPPDRPGVLALRPGHHQATFQRLLDLSLKALDG
jgi:hypothetical protein